MFMYLLHSLTSRLGMYHAMTWPQISFVAEDHKGRIVGYVLAKMCVGFSCNEYVTYAKTQRRRVS